MTYYYHMTVKMAATISESDFKHFIKILMENIYNIQVMCEKYKNKDAGIEAFAERSLEKLEELEKKLKKAESNLKETSIGAVKECLQLYAQVLLDVTFCEENVLVDGVFPEKNAAIRVHKLLTMLRQPEVICQYCFPKIPSKDILGEEIMECLLWRRGALLYMYCHTVQEDSVRLNKECGAFCDNCRDGAVYLQHMLAVRQPLEEERHEVCCANDQVFQLLKKGVFSETHVLSLLYAGELCYWHVRHSGTLQSARAKQKQRRVSSETESGSSKSGKSDEASKADCACSTEENKAKTNEQNKNKKSQKAKDKSGVKEKDAPSTTQATTEKSSKASAKDKKSDDTSDSSTGPESTGKTNDPESTAATSGADSSAEKEAEKDAFNARGLGSGMLQLYLDVVQGPLKNCGWRLERARELLAYIEQSSGEVALADTTG